MGILYTQRHTHSQYTRSYNVWRYIVNTVISQYPYTLT